MAYVVLVSLTVRHGPLLAAQHLVHLTCVHVLDSDRDSGMVDSWEIPVDMSIRGRATVEALAILTLACQSRVGSRVEMRCAVRTTACLSGANKDLRAIWPKHTLSRFLKASQELWA